MDSSSPLGPAPEPSTRDSLRILVHEQRMTNALLEQLRADLMRVEQHTTTICAWMWIWSLIAVVIFILSLR